MYVIELTFTCPVDEVQPQVVPHLNYLDEHYAKKHFIASGAKNPRDGGIIIANGKLPRDELDKIISEDPFYKHNMADYRVVEFVVDKYDDAIESLL
ncbi:hypothetical protein R84981_002519 [Carnimonas sp. R-84981]|uniref:YciI family protein n=1 Tax=Carnimonas bestiolae TaxID=3402172 RepID=UPI003EDB8E2F